MDSWTQLATRLSSASHLTSPPIAITFADTVPAGVEPFGAPMPPPTPDGCTGAVAAGCVFWNHAAERTFATVATDHGNCSVGSLTHGLIDLEVAAVRADVGAVVESGWVTPDVFPQIPVVTTRPAASVGCALSRARTGMAATDFTCAIPGARLGEVVDAIEHAGAVDAGVARYAGDDAARFASNAAS